MHMKQQIVTILLLFCGLTAMAQQDRHVQHKPYIDLRPMHFGILVGMHLQDIEGVLGELRLTNNFSLRVTPTMHFGAKHLTLLNMKEKDETGQFVRKTQDMKNTYVSLPIDLKFAAPRWNNCRPYIMAGVNAMMNLTSGEQDMIRLKRFNTMAEVGLGCDFYLPFFKLIPELKFCFGLSDVLNKNHVNELRDANLRTYAGSVSGAQSKMIVLTFYFE